MQAKRAQVNEQNVGAGSATGVFLSVPTDPREEVNFHNIWAHISVEPQDAGANCQGTWVVWVRRENAPSIIFTDTIVNTEVNNAVIIAMGVFSASNESVYNNTVQIKTSRTLMPGDQLGLSTTITGITAGLASTRNMLMAHTTRK